MTLLRGAALAALVFSLGSPLAAQVFPTRAEGHVTDDAQLIDDDAEAVLVTRLPPLKPTAAPWSRW